MNGKIAVLATTSILTFGIAIPAFAQNDNRPVGSLRAAEDATAQRIPDSHATMSDDTEEQAREGDAWIAADADTDGAVTTGKTMQNDAKQGVRLS